MAKIRTLKELKILQKKKIIERPNKICGMCCRSFSYSNMAKHRRICLNKNGAIDFKLSTLRNVPKEIKKLQKENKKMMKKLLRFSKKRD